MSGLRERKKLATRLAIHEAGMRLFAERGFNGTTVDDIADAAGISRATVFSYYPTKEEIVFGEAAAAVDGLAMLLSENGGPTIAIVRGWLTELTGWLEAQLLVQLQLVREAPTVAARRLQIYSDIEHVIADALERELGPERRLAARLSAATMMAGLGAIENAAAERLAAGGSASGAAETERILDATVAYLEAGLSAT